jgi:MFS family permease
MDISDGAHSNSYLNVVSDLVNLGAMLLIRAAPASSSPVRESPWQSLTQGTRYVLREANVRTLLLAVAALSLLGRPYTQLLPVFARDVFHTGPQELGVTLTMPAIGAVAAAFGLGLLESASTPWLLAMSVAQALALGAFAASPLFGVPLALLFAMGATSAVASALANTLLLQLVEERMRGRVMGFFMAATWGGWRLGAFPAGLVAEGWGAQPALGLCAATLLAVQVPLARSSLLRAGLGALRGRAILFERSSLPSARGPGLPVRAPRRGTLEVQATRVQPGESGWRKDLLDGARGLQPSPAWRAGQLGRIRAVAAGPAGDRGGALGDPPARARRRR